MGLPMVDSLVALFFLFSLVLVARFRTELRANDHESYNYLSGGLAILSVVTLTRIYGTVGLFSTIPFMSDPLLFKVLCWIGIITGATFVVSGVSSWLPLARVNRRSALDRMQRLELIKKVEQLAMVDTRLAEIMSLTLDYMVDLSGFSWGAVYGCSPDSDKMTLLSTSGGVAATAAALQAVDFDGADFNDNAEADVPAVMRVRRKLPDSMAAPTLIMPLVVNDRVHGAFLLWTTGDDTGDRDEVRVNLKLAVDIIARRIDLDARRTAAAIDRHRRDWRDNLAETVDYTKDLKENFAALARLITRRFRAECVSLSVVTDDSQMRRLTVGAGGTLLDEIGVALPATDSHVRPLLQSGKPLIADIPHDPDGPPTKDPIVTSLARSLVAVPVMHRNKPCAVLTVTSVEPKAYQCHDRLLLESAVSLVRGLIVDESHRNASADAERRTSLVTEFSALAAEFSDLQILFQRGADLLLSELRCSMVRISTYAQDGAFLTSRAVAHDPSVAPPTPNDGHMILSLMPLHQSLRHTGRILMITGADDDQLLTVAEASQAFFAEVQSAVLMPVTLGKQVLAVIGLADARPWERARLRRADMLLIRSIAAVLALAIPAGTVRKELGIEISDEITEAGGAEAPSRLRGRVKSSLSGILGSVEMIKSRRPSSDPVLDRQLAIIDKSANHINDCFAENE